MNSKLNLFKEVVDELKKFKAWSRSCFSFAFATLIDGDVQVLTFLSQSVAKPKPESDRYDSSHADNCEQTGFFLHYKTERKHLKTRHKRLIGGCDDCACNVIILVWLLYDIRPKAVPVKHVVQFARESPTNSRNCASPYGSASWVTWLKVTAKRAPLGLQTNIAINKDKQRNLH